MLRGQRKVRTQYLVLVGLGGQPLVQGSDFGGQVLETLPEHFFLWRQEQSHVQSSPTCQLYLLETSHHSGTTTGLPPGRQEARCCYSVLLCEVWSATSVLKLETQVHQEKPLVVIPDC